MTLHRLRDRLERRFHGRMLLDHLVDDLPLLVTARPFAHLRPQVLVLGTVVELELLAKDVPATA